jgi:hypothetical protein
MPTIHGHRHLHDATLQAMMVEAVEMISWPEEGTGIELEEETGGGAEE